ncbi:MAG TPA: replication-relaxation family protein [Solirubrobacteraceae bacterium]|nr:replication-relaxation family protein [Solirubrobacteraceae bacterium]
MHRLVIGLAWQSPIGESLVCGSAVLVALVAAVFLTRAVASGRRRYVRLVIEPYRSDHAEPEALSRMLEALHAGMARAWWARLLAGQPSVALEIHYSDGAPAARCWFAVSLPAGTETSVQAALRTAYANCRLRPLEDPPEPPAQLVRLRKKHLFIRRAKVLERFDHDRNPPTDRLLTVMGSCGGGSLVQLALTPAADTYRALARSLHAGRQARGGQSQNGRANRPGLAYEAELRGGMDLVHVPLFLLELRVAAASRGACRTIASELQVEAAENRLVRRRTRSLRASGRGLVRRLGRGERSPFQSPWRSLFAPSEIASLWQLPSPEYSIVPVRRGSVPVAPAPPGVYRPAAGRGTLRDEYGPVSIECGLRRQNTAVPGTVEQGKTSYLVATIAEDLSRDRCAIILFDPKGDAADAAISVVEPGRTCTLLDFARPTCGFNPLAVDAPADVIADYVVAALRNLFSDADIRASSDRYLRNAVIAVLAYDRRCTLWDAARLLSVGEEGYAFRKRVAAAVRTLPEFSEISAFFTAEIGAQLADARSMTTAKLDAPVNKLARLLNSASIKRVLLNESLRIDFDRVIAGGEVLIVKGALGVMGAGNTSVLMQLLVGMLDAALARQQDLVAPERRTAVALKVDEAPLVLNRGFAETMALKRSAGLETVACWQTDAQWSDPAVRDQLDALFAHRVYFATASVSDARSAASLTMSEFSDSVRPGTGRLSALGHPDVRLHLPKHHAIASWSTAGGRQAAFIGRTIPLRVDPERIAQHAARQHARGARHQTDLRRRHWDQRDVTPANAADRPALEPATEPTSVPGPGGGPASRAAGLPAAASAAEGPAATGAPARSYAELVDIDRAQSVRWGRRGAVHAELEPEPLDLEILLLMSELRHLLSSQIHRWFNEGRAPSTTQRRLKRLSDAGLVERMQFHRRDGGGAPMCYRLTSAGQGLLISHGAIEDTPDVGLPNAGATNERDSPSRNRIGTQRELRQVRREVHVAGWALSLMRAMDLRPGDVRGRESSVLTPRASRGGSARGFYGPDELRLPGGRVPHDFLSSRAGGEPTFASGRREVEQFESVRPDAVVRVAGVDIFIELDDRVPEGTSAAKLERYDHFLTGWSLNTRRYGDRGETVAEVVFVCRDRARARECARAADHALCAARAYAGEYPFDWDYTGRRRISFAAERDIHEGSRLAYGVADLPPSVRAEGSGREARALEAAAVTKNLPLAPLSSHG